MKLATPAVAIKLAGTMAVNCVELANVVTSGEPFHTTTAPETKPVPCTVSVNAGPPAVTPPGEQPVYVGAGAPAIVNVTGPERYPPGLTTVMAAVPVLAIKVAGTVAVNCIELTNAVARAEPFHCTVLPETKLVP